MRLEEAVAAYGEALSERTRDRVPLKWAETTFNQALALAALAERREDAHMAETAIAAAEAANALFQENNLAFNMEFYKVPLQEIRPIYDKLIGKRRAAAPEKVPD